MALAKSDIKIWQLYHEGYSHEIDRKLDPLDLQENFIAITDAIVDEIQPNIANLQEGETTVTSIDDTDSPYTALGTDNVILADDTSGSITINLPAAASSTGKIYYVKKLSASNSVTVDGADSETIDGATTQVLSTQYDALAIVCDGTGWYII